MSTKFGVREICDVVLKAKSRMVVGNKVFYKDEPVIYFDTLKTSSMEGASTTVYAQGSRGNTRLMAWEGERTVTFTMEDALISPEGFMILSGAGLVDASEAQPIMRHMAERIDKSNVNIKGETCTINNLEEIPYVKKGDNYTYVMFVKDDEIITEPYILSEAAVDANGETNSLVLKAGKCIFASHEDKDEDYEVEFPGLEDFDSVIVDYYAAYESNAQRIEISADSFGGNFYLEASTLFRNVNGVDMPAEFTIPNCKIQSNFTFSMASSGDPSTFTFTMDAFPDYTRFDHSKKVLAAIDIIKVAGAQDLHRGETKASVETATGALAENHEMYEERPEVKRLAAGDSEGNQGGVVGP